LTFAVTPTGDRSAVDERLRWAAQRLSELRIASDSFLPNVREDLVAAASVASFTFTNVPQSELGSMAGDVIHNLRACLDNLVWEIAPAAARSARTAFPIRSTDSGFTLAAARSLRGLPTAVIDAIRSVQPFVDESHGGLADGGGQLLKLLDDFWNDDKHRVSTVAVGTLSVVPPNCLPAGTSFASIARMPEAKREVRFKLQREDLSATVDVFMRMHFAVYDVIKRVRTAR